uniref:Uncharacterized protein n=1 Tax=Candidatus Kentrum sp. FM TaxID=2126340 RepID=A0A450TRF7_9GAMM|nr:MAG: hypothetical protein BECKFM1743C_GA0114222_105421 [Candidatus Kentron sp. FM]VFJ70631.1 MAG: hypothetical protein BECKFM1743A_GA0114220_105561 [Candidatus Kentron sp. FM]
MNYFKHVQRGRRALSILQLTLKFKWNGPLGEGIAHGEKSFGLGEMIEIIVKVRRDIVDILIEPLE